MERFVRRLSISLNLQDIFFYFERAFEGKEIFLLKLFICLGKFHIHKSIIYIRIQSFKMEFGHYTQDSRTTNSANMWSLRNCITEVKQIPPDIFVFILLYICKYGALCSVCGVLCNVCVTGKLKKKRVAALIISAFSYMKMTFKKQCTRKCVIFIHISTENRLHITLHLYLAHTPGKCSKKKI